MSQIVSPHPPIVFTIELDPVTFAATFNPSQPVDFLVIMKVFHSLLDQMANMRLAEMQNQPPPGNPPGNPARNPFENPGGFTA